VTRQWCPRCCTSATLASMRCFTSSRVESSHACRAAAEAALGSECVHGISPFVVAVLQRFAAWHCRTAELKETKTLAPLACYFNACLKIMFLLPPHLDDDALPWPYDVAGTLNHHLTVRLLVVHGQLQQHTSRNICWAPLRREQLYY
jgi:hypothetical protein